MAGRTLADFARALGIPPVTARSWKHRGRIVEDKDSPCGRYWLRCTDCRQLYDPGDACHSFCSEECAKDIECTCAACVRQAKKPDPTPLYVRTSSGATPEQIAESRKKFEEMKADVCAGCADLRVGLVATQADIASLVAENTLLRDLLAKVEADIRFLRTMLGHSDPPVILGTASASERAAEWIAAHRQG